jgi:hypothetical protein
VFRIFVFTTLVVMCHSALASADAQPPAAKPPASSTGRLRPFTIDGSDGSKLALGFAGQLRWTLTNTGSHLDDADRETSDSMDLRRVRVLLGGEFLDEQLSFRLQLSTSPSSPELMDAYAEFPIRRPIQLRVGQFKVPFTRYRWQSFTRLLLADWPVAATHFGAERQMALMAYNDQNRRGWSFALAMGTGVNARASFATGIAEAYAQKLPNPSSLRSPAPAANLHPEVIAQLAHNGGGIDTASNSDDTQGGFRHSVGLSAAWDLAPTERLDFAERLAPEVLIKVNGVSLDLVGYVGVFRAAPGSFRIASVGGTAEAAWRFCPAWEAAARYSRVQMTRALRTAGRGYADQLVADADPDDRDALRATTAAAGAVRATDEVNMGLNYYIVGDSIKWQNDVTLARRRSSTMPKEDIRFRSQLQLAF